LKEARKLLNVPEGEVGLEKIKVDDFKFAIRGNELMLGRVQELFAMDKELKEARKLLNVPEGEVGLEKVLGEKKGKRKGRPRKEKGKGKEKVGEDEEEEGEDE